MVRKIKILLVEDDFNLGFVVQDQLKSEGYDVNLCTDGVEGLQRYNTEPFDMCIFDVMMPKKDGFTLATDIRKVDVKIPILFLTAKNLTEDKVAGFKAGGDDYLTKPFSTEEFLLRVKAILKRVDLIDPKEIETSFNLGTMIFDSENFKLIYADKEEKKLTKKEVKILLLLVQNMNKVLTRDIVLNAVWGQDDYFVGRSLDVFITKLRKYLKPDETVSISNIHGVGFKLEVNA
ncbi:MAG: response regulator transcription factor [Crocinitomix sp.]|nr:response regulator transcription factor [Crocinitomix sp.]